MLLPIQRIVCNRYPPPIKIIVGPRPGDIIPYFQYRLLIPRPEIHALYFPLENFRMIIDIQKYHLVTPRDELIRAQCSGGKIRAQEQFFLAGSDVVLVNPISGTSPGPVKRIPYPGHIR